MVESARVLFVTSELFPLIKTGGLADVSAALPPALKAMGVDVRVLLPGYDSVLDTDLRWRTVIPGMRLVPSVWHSARLLAGELRGPGQSGVTLYAIDCPQLYRRPGGPYQDESGRDWGDNDARFALLGAVAAYLATAETSLEWMPDILHLNDWQAGLAAAYARFADGPKPAVVSTVHNLSYAGDFPGANVTHWGLPPHAYGIDGIEYYGRASFLKSALYFADRITTVSPTYAREIQSAPEGCGFEGLLASRAGDVSGILNGIDLTAWNPATDPAIPANFDASTLEAKAVNKAALQQHFGLTVDPHAPLLGMVTRLTWQKGVDMVLEHASSWLAAGAQIAVIGSGDPGLEQGLGGLSVAHPGAMGFVQGYDESLAHLVEAGADAFLMPSRFEPCGLNQMYSMRYGTVPIVRRTGGLADTVADLDESDVPTGVVFPSAGSHDLDGAVRRALACYRDTDRWQQLQRNGMAQDFGWHGPATEYASLYQALRPSARTGAPGPSASSHQHEALRA